MKKNLYAIAFGVLFAGTAGAQSLSTPDQEACPGKNMGSADKWVNESSSRGTPIWSEDFGSGFPATWTVDDQSGICPWVWSDDGSYGYFNGSQGASSGDTIQSTTFANGFLINDPDSANNVNYGQPSGSTYQYLSSYFETDVIDLTGFPDVILEFQQYYRYNNSVAMEVYVSGDGGTNWTMYDVSGGLNNNTASANPDVVKINISPVAGGSNNVKVRIGWSARVYYWMIDDMMIYEAPPHDLEMLDAGYYTQQTNYWGYNIPYSVIPSDQVLPIEFSSRIANGGSNTETNVFMNVDVNDGASSVFTTASAGGTVAPTDTLDAVGAQTFTTTTPNTYSIDMSVDYTDISLEDTPGDLVDTASFRVSQCEYGRDRGVFTTSGLYNGDDGAGSSDPYEMGNLYQMQNDFDLYGVRVAIDNTTDAGCFIFTRVYQVDQASGSRNLVYDGSGTNYGEMEVTTAMINSAAPIIWTDLLIDQGNGQPLTLQAGQEYIICVGHYGGPEYLYIMRGGESDPMTSFLLDGTDNTWYYLTSTPSVRMVGQDCVSYWIGVDEMAESGLNINQNQPNPFSESTQINYTLDRSLDVTFEVIDVTGKVIERKDLGTLPSGEHNLILNGNNYSEGMYFYTFTTERGTVSKRMIVTK